jgi:uncharacterized protein (DUF433 family)
MMLLGLVLHSAVSFCTLPLGRAWAYKDASTHVLFDVLVLFIHVFRMPLFFLMAGFFAAFLYYRRGPWARVAVPELNRITVDSEVMGGKPCIRGLRVTVGTVVGLVAAGHSREEILHFYPYLEAEDIPQALEYAAWRSEEVELPLARP